MLKSLFDTLLSDCHQDRNDNDITEEAFPLVDDGTGDREILEYSFGRTVTGHEAENVLRKKGYVLIGMKRAMEYVASHPDAQKAHPLIVLGAQGQNDSFNEAYFDCLFPYFGWDRGDHYLGLTWLSDKFSSSCRFLVVRG
ncbi:MAG: hypothetical protein NTU97_02985 [Candidatus Magasanikbacteria bacterium]|nr:hypothetical protein [Candidatus Magasanikbacteria bacterium]